MQRKELLEYVEEEVHKTVGLNARITEEDKARLDMACKLHGWKYSFVVRAGLRKFLDEVKELKPV